MTIRSCYLERASDAQGLTLECALNRKNHLAKIKSTWDGRSYLGDLIKLGDRPRDFPWYFWLEVSISSVRCLTMVCTATLRSVCSKQWVRYEDAVEYI